MTHKRKLDFEKNNKNLEEIEVAFQVKQILDDSEEDEYFRFEGLASTFGNIDLVDDFIEKGAFVESLQRETPILLWQHQSWEPIGMPEVMEENQEGLYLLGRLPKADSLVKGRVIPQMRVGSIRKMSIGFIVKDYEIIDGIRHIKKALLKEVSLVTFPANPLASVTGFKSIDPFLNWLEKSELPKEQKELIQESMVRFKNDYQEMPPVSSDDLAFLENIKEVTPRNVEKALRDSKIFSKKAAATLVSVLTRSDSEVDDNNDLLKTELKKMNDKLKTFDFNSQITSMLEKFGD